MVRFVEKTDFYIQHGVRLLWVIDPATRTVAVLAPGAESRTLRMDDTLAGGDVLPGFSLSLGDLFAQLTA